MKWNENKISVYRCAVTIVLYTYTMHTCAYHTHNHIHLIPNKQSINWCHFHFSVEYRTQQNQQQTCSTRWVMKIVCACIALQNEKVSVTIVVVGVWSRRCLFCWCRCGNLFAKYTLNKHFYLYEWLIYHLFKKSLFLSITRICFCSFSVQFHSTNVCIVYKHKQSCTPSHSQ